MDWPILVALAIFGTVAVVSGVLVKGSPLKKFLIGIVWGTTALVVTVGIVFAGCLAMISASK
jgi:VIT1/CCC1 family predicted Fe2+/Mn2+ transporter